MSLFSMQEILAKAFVNNTNVLKANNLYSVQDYFNAVYDTENDSLRISVEGDLLKNFNGVNQLVKTGSDGKLVASVIPDLAITRVFAVDSGATGNTTKTVPELIKTLSTNYFNPGDTVVITNSSITDRKSVVGNYMFAQEILKANITGNEYIKLYVSPNEINTINGVLPSAGNVTLSLNDVAGTTLGGVLGKFTESSSKLVYDNSNIATESFVNGLIGTDDTTGLRLRIKSVEDGKQNSLGFTPVPNTVTINSKQLNGNIALNATDVGLGNVTNESKTTMFTSPTFTGTATTGLLNTSATYNNLATNLRANQVYVNLTASSNTTSNPRALATKLALTASSGVTIGQIQTVHENMSVVDGTGTVSAIENYSSLIQASGPVGSFKAYSLNSYGAITGAITNFYGYYMAPLSYAGAGAITNLYGVYIEDTNAKNYFGGKMGVGIQPSTYGLTVAGGISINSGNLDFGSGNARIATTADGSGQALTFLTYNGTAVAERWRIGSTGNLNNTGSTGTAYIHIKAGTTAAGTGPLKFTVTGAALLTTPEAGLMEVDASGNLYWTATTVRNQVVTGTVGTGANNIVALDSNSKLPAVDGSQLTNLPKVSTGFTGTFNGSNSTGFAWTDNVLIITHNLGVKLVNVIMADNNDNQLNYTTTFTSTTEVTINFPVGAKPTTEVYSVRII